MGLKLTVLKLSESMKWSNWPTWLKGFFLLWPSLGPAYLFITSTPVPTSGEAELSTIMTNVEYQNYFIVVFIGFWSINLILLGMTWVIGSVVSDTYRSYLREKSKVRVKRISEEPNVPSDTEKIVKKYPLLVKKGSQDIASEPKTVKKVYKVLKKKDSPATSAK